MRCQKETNGSRKREAHQFEPKPARSTERGNLPKLLDAWEQALADVHWAGRAVLEVYRGEVLKRLKATFDDV